MAKILSTALVWLNRLLRLGASRGFPVGNGCPVVQFELPFDKTPAAIATLKTVAVKAAHLGWPGLVVGDEAIERGRCGCRIADDVDQWVGHPVMHVRRLRPQLTGCLQDGIDALEIANGVTQRKQCAVVPDTFEQVNVVAIPGLRVFVNQALDGMTAFQPVDSLEQFCITHSALLVMGLLPGHCVEIWGALRDGRGRHPP